MKQKNYSLHPELLSSFCSHTGQMARAGGEKGAGRSREVGGLVLLDC